MYGFAKVIKLYYLRAKRAVKQIDTMISQIVRENEDTLVNLNIDQIFVDGETIRGYPITPQYSPEYRDWKIEENLYQGYVDLHVSGRYFSTFELKITPKDVTIKAKGYMVLEKDKMINLAEKLREDYGPVEGWTDENLEIIHDLIISKLPEKLSMAIFGRLPSGRN